MTTPIQYRRYGSDEQKAKLYNHRCQLADNDFASWEDKAKDWWDRYENVPKASQASRKGRTVNVTTGVSVIDALFSGMTAVDVEFLIEPTAEATPEQALVAETALNQEWLLCDVDKDRDDAVKDALVTGIGFVKVGYDFFVQNSVVDRDPGAITAEVQELIAQAEAYGVGAPTVDEIAKLVPDKETVEEVLRDRIIVDYVAWDRVRWDPTVRRWEDVRWVAQYTKMTLADVKNNPLWREYVKRNRAQGGLKLMDRVTPDSSIDRALFTNSDFSTTMKPMEGDDGRCTVVEFHDLESGTVCTFLKGQNWLLNETVNPFALHHDLSERSAFVPLVLRSTTRRVRGISDMEVMLRSLNEKNLYRSRTATYLDRIVPKVMGPEDALTEEGKEALSSNEIGAYVSIDAKYPEGAKTIQALDPPPLPSEAFDMNDRIDDEIREATGVNELMRGLFPDRKRTATETNEVVSASSARQSEKRNTLMRFHVGIARRMLHLMQQFYEQPRMARFVDASLGETKWEFTGSDILGEFDLKVSMSPREEQSRDAHRQDATVLFNILAPFALDPQNAVLDKTQLVQWYMKKYGVSRKDMNELFQSPAEQQVSKFDQQQQEQGAPPVGPLTPQQLLSASNGPATLGAAVGGQVPPEQVAVGPAR